MYILFLFCLETLLYQLSVHGSIEPLKIDLGQLLNVQMNH